MSGKYSTRPPMPEKKHMPDYMRLSRDNDFDFKVQRIMMHGLPHPPVAHFDKKPHMNRRFNGTFESRPEMEQAISEVVKLEFDRLELMIKEQVNRGNLRFYATVDKKEEIDKFINIMHKIFMAKLGHYGTKWSAFKEEITNEIFEEFVPKEYAGYMELLIDWPSKIVDGYFADEIKKHVLALKEQEKVKANSEILKNFNSLKDYDKKMLFLRNRILNRNQSMDLRGLMFPESKKATKYDSEEDVISSLESINSLENKIMCCRAIALESVRDYCDAWGGGFPGIKEYQNNNPESSISAWKQENPVPFLRKGYLACKALEKLATDYSYAIEPQEELLLDLSSNSFVEKLEIIFINYLYGNDGVFTEHTHQGIKFAIRARDLFELGLDKEVTPEILIKKEAEQNKGVPPKRQFPKD